MLYRLVEEWGEANGNTMPYDELANFLVSNEEYFTEWARIEANEGGYVPTIKDYIKHLVRYGFVEEVAEN